MIYPIARQDAPSAAARASSAAKKKAALTPRQQ